MYHLKHIAFILGLVLLSRLIVDTCSFVIDDLTSGFTPLPFDESSYIIQTPYDRDGYGRRYTINNGVYKLWIYSNDKSYSRSSNTSPRCEVYINRYTYSTGVWQFEGEVYVPPPTSGVSIMQVFGASPPQATTSMIRVYNGNLCVYKEAILNNIYKNWVKLNVIHDVDDNNVKVYVNGNLMSERSGRGGNEHYFKFGVYKQDQSSHYMESQWRNIKIYRKY